MGGRGWTKGVSSNEYYTITQIGHVSVLARYDNNVKTLPVKATPNAVYASLDKYGYLATVRTYNAEGNPVLDYHFDHTHRKTKMHVQKWIDGELSKTVYHQMDDFEFDAYGKLLAEGGIKIKWNLR